MVTFLALGLVAGLTESAERALVARLAPVRTGRGFGLYHALTGAAALPAGLLFGDDYQIGERTRGPVRERGGNGGWRWSLWLVASPRTPERAAA